MSRSASLRGALQVAHVTDVQHVETAVGERDRAAARRSLGEIDELDFSDDHERPIRGARPAGATIASSSSARDDRGGTALHDDQAAGMIGEPRRLAERRARGQRQRERGDHRVAGASHVGDLIGADDRNVIGRLCSGSNSAMPRLPRVISTARDRSRCSSVRPARSSASRSSPIRTPSSASTSDSLGVHAVMPPKPASA